MSKLLDITVSRVMCFIAKTTDLKSLYIELFFPFISIITKTGISQRGLWQYVKL